MPRSPRTHRPLAVAIAVLISVGLLSAAHAAPGTPVPVERPVPALPADAGTPEVREAALAPGQVVGEGAAVPPESVPPAGSAAPVSASTGGDAEAAVPQSAASQPARAPAPAPTAAQASAPATPPSPSTAPPPAPAPVPAPTPAPTVAPAPAPAAAETLEERVERSFEAAVPGAWRLAVPVRLAISDGQYSWAHTSGLIEVASAHAAGDLAGLGDLLAHEFGHLIAFRYGTQAYAGAPPAGWPGTGPRPEEAWADCVQRAFTGRATGTHGQQPCDGGALAWTTEWLAKGPLAHPRTR
jgi:hypothetical protein